MRRVLGWLAVLTCTNFALVLGSSQPIPPLPFPDQQDASVCGIPTAWGSSELGKLDGHYQGKLWQPRVYLYDSHARQRVVGSAPTGSRVNILLHQANPVLSFYLVRTVNTGIAQEGWVPAPFLQVNP